MVREVKNFDEFKQMLVEAGDKLVVVDFFATWCGPCKNIAPTVQQFSKDYESKVVFLKVDVDDNEDIAAEYNIASMPTFVFIKKGEKVESFSGASAEKLQNMIEALLKSAE